MDSPRGLGIARVALTLQVTIAPDKLDAMLPESDRQLAAALAARVDAWVRNERLGYYPALDYLVDQGVIAPEQFGALRALAATIRKRVKRDIQMQLWPVFSSVQIERAQSLAFLLPRLMPGRADAARRLAEHYFPNVVRLELTLSSLDKHVRLEDATGITEHKVMRNLLDVFEAVTVSATRHAGD
jgi:hypothetical protein